MSTFKERARQEATKNPIFLLQRRQIFVIGEPEDYYLDADGGEFTTDNGDALTFKTCFEKDIADAEGNPVLREEWLTIGVAMTREEGDHFFEAQEYNYREGWRVFCVPCVGNLAEVITQHERHCAGAEAALVTALG